MQIRTRQEEVVCASEAWSRDRGLPNPEWQLQQPRMDAGRVARGSLGLAEPPQQSGLTRTVARGAPPRSRFHLHAGPLVFI